MPYSTHAPFHEIMYATAHPVPAFGKFEASHQIVCSVTFLKELLLQKRIGSALANTLIPAGKKSIVNDYTNR